MAEDEGKNFLAPPVLAPLAVAALREQAGDGRLPRGQMERTISMDIREEREDLKEAAEHTSNVILDLTLNGKIKWVSPSWQDVIGTTTTSVLGKPITDIITANKCAFDEAVESMKQDDSRSQIVRFAVQLGPLSRFKPDPPDATDQAEEDGCRAEEIAEQENTLNLEGQGIMVYDHSAGSESHTMWMIRPSIQPREVTIDLPEVLVESLGVGAEMLAHYLTSLAEVGANDPANHPPPLPVLCRICERQITPWWFEKHSELCLQEHRAEMEVQMSQEGLTEHRNAIVKVLDALEARNDRPTSGDITMPSPPQAEYKGLLIGPTSTPSSGPSSGRSSPASPPQRSRETSTSGPGHARARSFAVRRPLTRIVELLLDLCDTAIEISTPAIKEARPSGDIDFRTQSPTSESRISQVLQWQSPSTNTLEQEQGLAALCADTENSARTKVEAVLRHRRIIEYSERIRIEFHMLVQDCIDAAMEKAARIAAGQISDSTDGEDERDEEEDEKLVVNDEALFAGSFDGPPSLATSFLPTSDISMAPQLERNLSSATMSTRSSSPKECPTPRSRKGTIGILGQYQQQRRGSLFMESDAGESDNSVQSSVIPGIPRTDSPSSEYSQSRTARSRERNRRSLILPNVASPHRQQSPARSIPAVSPYRTTKPRLPVNLDNIPSPIMSPVLSTSEFSSPAIAAHHHRRQSSAASSDVLRPPVSPRLTSVSQPQPRAVATSIKDFEIIKPISKGAFGSVYLSKKKSTGDYYAIKVLKKTDMVAKNQVTNVKAERAIMMWQGESEFVAKLYWTFSSKDYLYLVMEYLNGGDCASLIKVLGGLSEDWAKKYLAEVLLGVEHLHERGIVHRDLKPDNLLIDQKGHLKLTDFGLSRMGLVGRQKRVLSNGANESAPDLLRQGGNTRSISVASSRSASFDFQGHHSPGSTPQITPDLAVQHGQPSYFSLNRDNTLSREHSRRHSGYRSDSGNEALNAMFRSFSLSESADYTGSRRIEEETPSEGSGSPDPYVLHPTASHSTAGQYNSPPQPSMMPPPMALFDPEDSNRRFVGTPDYLAPETINGVGQDEMSDWWSLGCILFEFLFGYPPFHADTPEKVFENILQRRIQWPDDEEFPASDEAKDLMNRLMCVNPRERLGANINEKYSCGGEEIRKHPWFKGMNWESLLEDEAQFIPAPGNPEDTEYFDARGATLQSFAEELEDQASPPLVTPGDPYPERPHDALSRVRTQVNTSTMKRGLMPLHIPPHVRDGRNRRLSEPVVADDFGNFAFKNLPVLEKANKDVIQKLRAEAMQAQAKAIPISNSPSTSSPAPSLEGSPILPMPLQRTLSTTKGTNRPASPSNLSQTNSSPSRASQPSSPLLVSFSAGNNHERRKTSSTSSTLSHQSSNSLQPGSFFDTPRLSTSFKTTSSAASSPIKTTKIGAPLPLSPQRSLTSHRQSSVPGSRARSHTVGSQDGDVQPKDISHHKRRSQVFDVSPSSSDNEDPRAKALLRVQRRRQSSRRMSQITLADGPVFRPLDVLICEDHPVSRMVMEKLLEKLRCRTITVTNGPEAMRYAMSEVKFDIIMMEFKLPQISGADVARMIRDTKNANSQTPIVAVTGYLKELQAPHHFDALMEKPATISKLIEVMCRLCQWRAPPPGYNPAQPSAIVPSGLRQESVRLDDSPNSNSSGFANMPGSSFRGSSREDSISSSFFGDNVESATSDDVSIIINQQAADGWGESGLGISEEAVVDPKPLLKSMPHLVHTESAPGLIESRTPRRKRSADAVKAKRESIEKKRHECAESGDDEDEELGDFQVRARSPQGKSARGSRLGVEMLRTNSRGSVISTSEDVHMNSGTSSPPPSIAENIAEDVNDVNGIDGEHHSTITPPEVFPRAVGEKVKEIDMDATPKPPPHPTLDVDDQPTPRASSSISLDELNYIRK
ncbi:MAG: rim15, signal transduction response regulator [Pycnora praestabilis]|nr:MAG: rim15, signal transduction response regulator [Pycnora praestabilis]